MSEIVVRAEDVRDVATQMTTAATEAEAQFNTTRTRLTDIAGSFKGQTADNFEIKFEEWRKNATDLVQSLNDLSDFLSSAATNFEQADADMSKQIN